jgi:hypothetical protein
MIDRDALFQGAIAKQLVLLKVFAAHITKTLATVFGSLVSDEFQQPASEGQLLETAFSPEAQANRIGLGQLPGDEANAQFPVEGT